MLSNRISRHLYTIFTQLKQVQDCLKIFSELALYASHLAIYQFTSLVYMISGYSIDRDTFMEIKIGGIMKQQIGEGIFLNKDCLIQIALTQQQLLRVFPKYFMLRKCQEELKVFAHTTGSPELLLIVNSTIDLATNCVPDFL